MEHGAPLSPIHLEIPNHKCECIITLLLHLQNTLTRTKTKKNPSYLHLYHALDK